ncbi:Gfo/Idh/MocA family protein [Salipiger mangrovisoli]|uniref:Gfo/Idh/MocA family oxidoreductase n=1 Tax=Salipiger mangrovisoli TaxID=2865933 RepID=A0ABR9XBG1_9RHOB|nr:Gfo/Idh/MocA family oxidoreductase [Salipiger mangrovisoli]MBE9640959.1 Gfo/Idh/MocA family oxidoreductase [Salipiger mangrovisoli]
MSFPSALPASRVPDPMDAPALRWGVLGTGWIAQRFIESVRAHSRQEIAAVGSRSQASADGFAADWQIGTAHGSYGALVGDPSLDVIYVATPHNLHAAHVEMALMARKHVLVEKPMVLSLAEGERLVALARAQGVFLAEALWTYFLPKFDVLDQLFAAGALGEIRSVHTEYGEYFSRDHRIFDPALAGGPLNDLGTYPVSLLTRLLGVPKTVLGLAQMDASGVQGHLSVILADAQGNQGTLSTTLYGFTPTNAAIVGTAATLRFGSAFNLPGPFQLISADGSRVLDYVEPPGRHFEGLCYEAAEVARCIAGGLGETPKRPLQETLATLATMDAIRAALASPA